MTYLLEGLPSYEAYHHQMEYVDHRQRLVDTTNAKREEYRAILDQHLKSQHEGNLLVSEDIRHLAAISFLLSSSRGGSSITMDMLRQQAQSAEGSLILSVPGEQRPYLELTKLTAPFKVGFSDTLDENSASANQNKHLLTEIFSEIGYPLSETSDLLGYAITIYGRLLLQWPNINFGNARDAIIFIERSLQDISVEVNGKLTYKYQPGSIINLLERIQQKFPEIDLRYYDGTNITPLKMEISQTYDSFIEEPPFILPNPWHYATIDELKRGTLVLKDPSDAWRIPFWEKLFYGKKISWIHLNRNPQETINGLCDGWKYPHGYLTTRSPYPIIIQGYTHQEDPNTRWYANFSTSDGVWDRILDNKPVVLEEVTALQWYEAHKSIQDHASSHPRYSRLIDQDGSGLSGFEWMRTSPVAAIAEICRQLEVQLTPTLLKAANRMATNRVQTTPGVNIGHDRWKASSNIDLIRKYSNIPEMLAMSASLGYTS